MIKKFSNYLIEQTNSIPPGPDTDGVVEVVLSKEEVGEVEDNPTLTNFITKNRISIIGTSMYYYSSDTTVIDILTDFFPKKISVNEELTHTRANTISSAPIMEKLESFVEMNINNKEEYDLFKSTLTSMIEEWDKKFL